MAEFIAIFLFFAGGIALLIVVHEYGHYLAGRFGGIPASDLRLRLLCFPQHVVIRDEPDWVSPVTETERYVSLVWKQLQTRPRVYLYVAGGLFLETTVLLAICGITIVIDRPRIGFAIALCSAMLLAPWLVIDGIAVVRRRINGDLSGLWQLARWPTALLVLALVAVRAGLLWYLV